MSCDKISNSLYEIRDLPSSKTASWRVPVWSLLLEEEEEEERRKKKEVEEDFSIF